jgi:archaellum component FlaG (FlaF/FlaG flagellin family)
VRQLNSLRSKLIIYIALAAILITSVALVLGYYTTRRQLYHQLEARAGALTDQIGYAFEVLIDSDDMDWQLNKFSIRGNDIIPFWQIIIKNDRHLFHKLSGGFTACFIHLVDNINRHP